MIVLRTFHDSVEWRIKYDDGSRSTGLKMKKKTKTRRSKMIMIIIISRSRFVRERRFGGLVVKTMWHNGGEGGK